MDYVKINNISLWILNLIFLNFLWGMTVILGLGIFGFGPACYAVQNVILDWIKDDYTPGKTFKKYVVYLKENIGRNILIGMLNLLVLVVLLVDLIVVRHMIYRIAIIVIVLIVAPFIFLYFPVMAHFEYESLKQSIFLVYQLTFRYPLYVYSIMIITVIGFSLLLYFLPFIAMFFGYAFINYVFNWMLTKIYIKEEVWE